MFNQIHLPLDALSQSNAAISGETTQQRDERIARKLLHHDHMDKETLPFFKNLSLAERAQLKYYLLLLVIQFPELFKEISDRTLFVRLLKTQRQTLNLSTHTQSMVDFRWMQKTFTRDLSIPALNDIPPEKSDFVDTEYKTEPTLDNPVDFFHLSGKEFIQKGEHTTAFRLYLYLIMLHQNKRVNTHPYLHELAAQWHLMTGIYYWYCHKANPNDPDLLRETLTHYLKSSYLSTNFENRPAPKFIVQALLDTRIQKAISQRQDALAIFFKLYTETPINERTQIILAWLENKPLFSEHFSESFLLCEIFSLPKDKLASIDISAIQNPYTQLCLRYTRSKTLDEQQALIRTLEESEKNTPNGLIILSEIYLVQRKNKEGIALIESTPAPDALLLYHHFFHCCRAYDTAHRIHRKFNKGFNTKTVDEKQWNKTLQNQMQTLHERFCADAETLCSYPALPLCYLRNIVVYLSKLGEPILAEKLVNAYLKDHPYENDPELDMMRGCIESFYEKTEDHFIRAEAYYKNALNAKPNHIPYLYALGDLAYKHSHHNHMRRTYYEIIYLTEPAWYPKASTKPSTSAALITAVFSIDLSRLNAVYHAKVDSILRGALTHWHHSQRDHENPNLPHHLKELIRAFFNDNFKKTDYPLLIQNWPEGYETERFNVMLTLAATLKRWRCYKALFFHPDFIDTIPAEHLLNIVQGFASNPHLLTRALGLFADTASLFAQKLEPFTVQLEALKSTNKKPTNIVALSVFGLQAHDADDSEESDTENKHLFPNFTK